jgi:uncharacterized membrane protein
MGLLDKLLPIGKIEDAAGAIVAKAEAAGLHLEDHEKEILTQVLHAGMQEFFDTIEMPALARIDGIGASVDNMVVQVKRFVDFLQDVRDNGVNVGGMPITIPTTIPPKI